MDFTGATNKFYDEDWDGEPEGIIDEPEAPRQPKPPRE
jgi:type I restriction enzyme R subunit